MSTISNKDAYTFFLTYSCDVPVLSSVLLHAFICILKTAVPVTGYFLLSGREAGWVLMLCAELPKYSQAILTA